MNGLILTLVVALAGVHVARGQEVEPPAPNSPFQASLRSMPARNHFCSAVIISNQWLLTAAHCVQGRTAASLKVVVGSYTLDPQGTEYEVAEFVKYPSFNPIYYEHDIALLRTATPIVMNADVRVIPLPSGDAPAGELVILSGWRSDILDEVPNDMMMARMVTIDNTECEQMHEAGDSHVNIYPTNVCARPRMAGCYCIIDSGAPLASENDVLIGVFSISAGCGRMLPAVYSRVHAYRGWITSVSGV
ncbi:trypsin-7-like [Culex pipiens pallens]|uniref:trypsin-7-like n=1 Tax=Culex pipiens pallens TaxID=42434 RepID=UPI001954CC2E|nr:trypsin-7-like [Culex pipiens pallens]